MSTTILLTRHGETESSEADLYYGRSESVVTSRGLEQQALLAQRLNGLPITAVYCSPLRRCAQAADLIGAYHHLVPIKIDDLVEVNHGSWEGLTRQQVTERFASSYVAWQLDPAANSPNDGESGYE